MGKRLTRAAPAVCTDRGVIAVPSSFRRSRAYRDYVSAVKAAKTYGEMVALLERMAAGSQRRISDRFAPLLDFSPTATYAVQFMNTTRLYQATMPRGSEARDLSERALRALDVLNHGAPRVGRKAQPPLADDEAASIKAARQRWVARLEQTWPLARAYRFDLSRLVVTLVRDLLPLPVSHQKALSALVRRRWTRLSDVVDQLAAWEIGVSVRRVRAARTHQKDTLSRFA